MKSSFYAQSQCLRIPRVEHPLLKKWMVRSVFGLRKAVISENVQVKLETVNQSVHIQQRGSVNEVGFKPVNTPFEARMCKICTNRVTLSLRRGDERQRGFTESAVAHVVL